MNVVAGAQSAVQGNEFEVIPTVTSSSAIAEGPRDALSHLKSCQLLHKCTRDFGLWRQSE